MLLPAAASNCLWGCQAMAGACMGCRTWPGDLHARKEVPLKALAPLRGTITQCDLPETTAPSASLGGEGQAVSEDIRRNEMVLLGKLTPRRASAPGDIGASARPKAELMQRAVAILHARPIAPSQSCIGRGGKRLSENQRAK